MRVAVTGDMKILSTVRSGLNDAFSNIAYNIDFCFQNRIPLCNLYVHHPSYQPFDEFFNFKDITYVKRPKISDYDTVSSFRNGEYTNLNIGTEKHISNFISLKDEYRKLIHDFSNHIGYHFRYMRVERGEETVEVENAKFLKKFENNYKDTNKYAIFSDSYEVNKLFQIYNNVKIFSPKVNINFDDNFLKNRRNNTLDSILCFHSMATCTRIYKSVGNFTNLAKMVNQNLLIKF
jgi:uncharacterized protein involved in tellurium resistance